MLLIGVLLFGILIGATAQIIVSRSSADIDLGYAVVTGLTGSLVGGLLISLLAGDGLAFRPSGIIGSVCGAIIVTSGWQWFRTRAR